MSLSILAHLWTIDSGRSATRFGEKWQEEKCRQRKEVQYLVCLMKVCSPAMPSNMKAIF